MKSAYRLWLRAPALGVRFWLLQATQLVSTVGTRTLQVAVAWYVAQAQHVFAEAGLVLAYAAAVEFYGRPLLAGFGDRLDRVHLLVVSFAMSLLGGGLVALTFAIPHISWLLILAGLTLTSLGSAVRGPLYESIGTTLVEPEKLPDLVGSRSLVSSISVIVSGGLGGTTLAAFGEFVTVLLALGSFLVASAIVLAIGRSMVQAPAARHGSWAGDVLSSINLVRYVRVEAITALLICAVDCAIYPFFTLGVPGLIQNSLHADARVISAADIVFAVTMTVSGVFVVPNLIRALGKRTTVAAGLGLLASGLAACALAVHWFAFVAAFVLLSSGLTMITIPIVTVRSTATPNSHRNRMFAASVFLATFMIPLSMSAFTMVVGSLGVVRAVLAGSVVVAAIIPLFLATGSIREVMRLSSDDLLNYYVRRYPLAFIDVPATSEEFVVPEVDAAPPRVEGERQLQG